MTSRRSTSTMMDWLAWWVLGLAPIQLDDWHGWSAPNTSSPEAMRGVWHVLDMKGNAVVTMDLNMLRRVDAGDTTSPKFYAIDTWRNYQSVLHSFEGLWLGSILLRLPITSYYFLLLPIAPSVSCSCLDALNTRSSKLPLSPTASRCLPLSATRLSLLLNPNPKASSSGSSHSSCRCAAT